ncbi:hypothetical protein BV25DRAFT_1127289 [Artomyces pyxidatus]|uniref:Uncharacterized protein n=1 Tax=Artomyces pyxidatus TaxID=48021 RepID=A0ACB8SU60_9AGAM|nr:hypothetical protein BV25DRAFT_1127289 [Artomyces pyxidatus]
MYPCSSTTCWLIPLARTTGDDVAPRFRELTSELQLERDRFVRRRQTVQHPDITFIGTRLSSIEAQKFPLAATGTSLVSLPELIGATVDDLNGFSKFRYRSAANSHTLALWSMIDGIRCLYNLLLNESAHLIVAVDRPCAEGANLATRVVGVRQPNLFHPLVGLQVGITINGYTWLHQYYLVHDTSIPSTDA